MSIFIHYLLFADLSEQLYVHIDLTLLVIFSLLMN
jgi:hypothetical protein